MKKIERNHPCPCGSGKKYKQCCLKRDEMPASGKRAEPISPPKLTFEASEHHQCGRLLQADTPNPSQYYRLGLTLQAQGNQAEAAECYRKARSLAPNYAEAHYALGVVLQLQGKFSEATECYYEALSLQPDSAGVYNNLGLTLQAQGKLDEAIAHYRQALLLESTYVDAHSNLIFTMDMSAKADMAELFRERKKWDETHAAPFWQAPNHTNDPSPTRCLRVGYVSADFRNHSAPRVFGGMLTRYDRSRFEVFAYSNYSGKDDLYTGLFKQNVTAWRDIADKSDEAVARMIREDQIDILVDLSGHTEGNRLLVFARKPAPIQITAWGYATGTGMRAMDVFLTDPVMAPPQDQQYFSEQLRYLPSAVGSFGVEPYPDVNELPALRDGVVTFGSFNRLAKISADVYRTWAEILLAVPRSRLILKTHELSDLAVREQVLRHFLQAGVAGERIIMLKGTTWHEHMRAYNQVDLALDPFPHGGGVTAIEGLVMGVPVVTLRWPTIAGRLSASIMTTLGQPDWIAESREEYVRLAVQKAADLPSLAGLRQCLRIIFAASVIGDQAAYARAVEREYRLLWQEWCANNSVGANRKGARQSHLQHDEVLASSRLAETISVPKALQEAREYHQTGHLAQAEDIYQKILRVDPEQPDALSLLGMIAQQTGRNDVAVDLIRKAIKATPLNPSYFNSLGVTLQAQGKQAEAAECYQKALALNPDYALAHFNLGNALKDQGKLDEAIEHYHNAISLKPDYPEAHNNLGSVFKEQGRLTEAIDCFRKTLLFNPEFADASGNLGSALMGLGCVDEAINCYREALSLRPDYIEAHNNLGIALQEQGKLDAAIMHCRQALALRPDYAEAYFNLGNALKDQGKLDEAVEHYHKALSLNPDYIDVYTNLLFMQSYHASLDPSEYLSLACGWEKTALTAQDRQLARARIFQRPPAVGRRLRVGYVSGDFRQHPVSYFIEQIFARHDRDRIELYAYSASDMRDAITERLAAQVEHWVPVTRMSDAAMRDRIEADGIDVLLDLSGHTRHNRLGVFARRAAPVQAHYLGFFASTGLTEMDYWIGDDILTPPEMDDHFSEQVWRLPRVWLSYKTIANAPEPKWQPIRDGTVWLGSFNSLGKLTPETLDLWAKLLLALPEGKLLLKTKEFADSVNRQRILDGMAERGISADRIALQSNSEWVDYMACYNHLDIALDPVGGHGGGTITCDALWMGVPVIHALGNRTTSRFTASMVNAIGHPEWIAHDEAEYIDKTVTLARDVPQRQRLRAELRARMACSPLCNASDLAISLENAYVEMFERWRAR